MGLVAIKLLELFSRALFVVVVMYSLPLAEAGQFGILVTAASLFTFAGNYDRHHDIQRRAVGMPPAQFDRVVKDALPFWGFNIALILPLYVVAIVLVGRMPLELALLTLAIAIGEQISTHAYQMAIVEPRYKRLVAFVAAKNAVLTGITFIGLFVSDGKSDLHAVVLLWSCIQLLGIALILGGWWRLQSAAAHDGAPLHARLFRQHRASFVHFQVGSVAIATLYLDRVGVSALLPLNDVGIYFRHILAISFVYQLFGVVYVNRMTPMVLGMARHGVPRDVIARRPALEFLGFSGLALIGFATAVVLDQATGRMLSSRFDISWHLLSVLLAGLLIRVAADCAALFCNAWHRERVVLRAQSGGLLVGATLLLGLTPFVGIAGPALANLAFSLIYLTLLLKAIRAMPRWATQ